MCIAQGPTWPMTGLLSSHRLQKRVFTIGKTGVTVNAWPFPFKSPSMPWWLLRLTHSTAHSLVLVETPSSNYASEKLWGKRYKMGNKKSVRINSSCRGPQPPFQPKGDIHHLCLSENFGCILVVSEFSSFLLHSWHSMYRICTAMKNSCIFGSVLQWMSTSAKVLPMLWGTQTGCCHHSTHSHTLLYNTLEWLYPMRGSSSPRSSHHVIIVLSQILKLHQLLIRQWDWWWGRNWH